MAKLGYLHKNNIELIICTQSTISYPLHNHVSVFTIGFVLDGSIELNTDKGIKIYQENDVFLILPYTPHCINAKSCYTLLSLCIDKELIVSSEFEKAIPDIANFLHDVIKQSAVEAKMIQWLYYLRLIGRMIPLQKETAISNLKMQLESHPEIKYSIDDMAAFAFVSKYHLIRSFKHEIGLTPHQFQIQNRIRKAQRLLETSITITEVALATGFCDQSHFIRHFEKIVGLTPTDYRLACKTIPSLKPPKQAK